jgi:hypothetical protein
MKTKEQKCGCGNTDRLISMTVNKDNRNGCQKNNVTAAPPIIINHHYIVGHIQTPIGPVPQIATHLKVSDYLGAVQVRWGMNRENYRVVPGLYAVGTPSDRSDVFVTANYKLTIDTVRKNIAGLNAWLLILDTKGVNVWCAAGKGTFGTKELVSRIQLTSLDKIVQHKRIILPQLGAVGVAAHQVRESTGFTVIYGPVRAADIPSFLQAGYKATKEMRHVNFNWYDRLKLVPNDLIYNMRYLGLLMVICFLLSGINGDGFSLHQASLHSTVLFQIIIAGYISGIVLTPLFLPYLFFRSFSFKGFLVGFVVASIMVLGMQLENSIFIMPIVFFLLSGISSFLAMNFTGASTFTSLAGVKKEMKVAVPIQIASGTIAAILIILNNIFSGK